MRLYVTNFPPQLTEHRLRGLFGRFGPVLSLEVRWSRVLGRDVGAAVVEMEDAAAAAAARGLNAQFFYRRQLFVTPLGRAAGREAEGKGLTSGGR